MLTKLIIYKIIQQRIDRLRFINISINKIKSPCQISRLSVLCVSQKQIYELTYGESRAISFNSTGSYVNVFFNITYAFFFVAF